MLLGEERGGGGRMERGQITTINNRWYFHVMRSDNKLC